MRQRWRVIGEGWGFYEEYVGHTIAGAAYMQRVPSGKRGMVARRMRENIAASAKMDRAGRVGFQCVRTPLCPPDDPAA